MSEPTQTNSDNSVQLPKVGLFVVGQQKLIKQNYNLVKAIRFGGVDTTRDFAQLFNNMYSTYSNQFDIYGYILPYHQFTTENAVSIIIKKLLTYPFFIGAYTDTTTGFYPSYHPATINNNILINTPLFSKQPLKFNEKLQHLFFMDILRQQAQQKLWLNIAEPLIEITSNDINYEQDLKELQNGTSV